MVHSYSATCSRFLPFPETFSPYQLPPSSVFKSSTALWPQEDFTTPSPLGKNTRCQIPLYFSHPLSVWPSSESATIAPSSAPHPCSISAPPLPRVPWPKCPLPVPSTHSVPRRAVGISKASLTTHPKQALMSNCRQDSHRCPTPTLPMPPLPGQVASRGQHWSGCWWDVLSLTISSRLLFQELIFQPASSGASLRATWWTEGAFSNFLFHREITREN